MPTTTKTPKKKRRGRPKKAAVAPETAAPVKKKKRGRPPGRRPRKAKTNGTGVLSQFDAARKIAEHLLPYDKASRTFVLELACKAIDVQTEA